MTREEYLKAVSQLINQADTTGTGIKGPTLGNLILRSIPGHWNQIGYSTLTQLLTDVAAGGSIRIGQNPDDNKTLTAWAQLPVADLTAVPSSAARFERLKREVWVAFVNASPPGARFFHRRSGYVVMGQRSPPQPVDDWIEIPLISEETQKAWARELITAHQLESLRETLGSPLWYAKFRDELRKLRPELLAQWNRIRSTRVAETVGRWCRQQGIAQDIVSARPQAETPLRTAQYVNDRSARQKILDALGKMSTHELLSIPIPGKYLIDAPDR
jgi:hypothetical protein